VHQAAPGELEILPARHVTAAPGSHRDARVAPTCNACRGVCLVATPAKSILTPATLTPPSPHPAFCPAPSLPAGRKCGCERERCRSVA
jgi:hypothetical protein